MKNSVLALVAMSAIAGVARAAPVTDIPTVEPAPDASPTATACASFEQFVSTNCALTWHGITLTGAHDIGVRWVSHGLPENGYNHEGESLEWPGRDRLI